MVTRTEELLKLAKAATPEGCTYWRSVVTGSDYQLKSQEWSDLLEDLDTSYKTASVPPETIKQLVELCRLQHEALKMLDYGTRFDEATEAIAAFDKFERGE